MAKIGLFNLEPFVVNTAMMRISTVCKEQGHDVEIYKPLIYKLYDRIYAFSIFDFTPKHYVSPDMVCGGSGFDIYSTLPEYYVKAQYDWSLYPDCDFSMIWFSKGCIRKCPFCIVPKTEGTVHQVSPKNLNPNGTYIKVMDDNFFANPKWSEAISLLKSYNQPVEFQNIDVRIIKPDMCESLQEFKHAKQIKIAWDNPKKDILDKLKLMTSIVSAWKIMCYVLIGFWSTEEEDLYRVEKLRELKIDPFVMPFDKSNTYQKRFARWVNHKAIFKTVKWRNYA